MAVLTPLDPRRRWRKPALMAPWSNRRKSASDNQATGPGRLPHPPRHTAASAWIAKGADVKVVQRILGHQSATMTFDLYGHLWDMSLWDAAKRFTDTTPTSEAASGESEDDADRGER